MREVAALTPTLGHRNAAKDQKDTGTMSLLRTKSVEHSLRDANRAEFKLKRQLGSLDLVLFGVGVIVGAGIFTLTGRTARSFAGPAIIISFAIAAIACALAALCYAELSSAVPVSGSAYTFSYATLGELVAWIIGWGLLLELILGAAVVTQGWSQYARTLLAQLGMSWPEAWGPGGRVDMLAVLLVVGLTALVARGIKESMRLNLALVALKLFIVLFVIIAGLSYVKAANYSPFVPPTTPSPTDAVQAGMQQPMMSALFGQVPTIYGVGGIMAGAAVVFFAYIGFDIVATTAEEARNPKRDLPIGIIGSLIICTLLYMAVALVITGMVHYSEIDPKAALATAFEHVGKPGFATLISAGAVAGLTTVVMTMIIGSTRVMFAICRDGLLPQSMAKTSPRTGTPVRITVTIGILIAAAAALTPIGNLEEMVNIGTLCAFAVVAIAIPILRRKRPDLPRAFRVPWSPVLPIVSAVVSIYLMLNLAIETWLRFGIWMLIGMVIYFGYGRRHSVVGRSARSADLAEPSLAEV